MGLLTDLLGDGNGTTGAVPYTAHPANMGGTNGFAVANRGYFCRVLGGGGHTISSLVVQVSTSSGNICVGVFSGVVGRNPPADRKATSGGLPCPAAGTAIIALTASVAVELTDYFAASFDNATARLETAGGAGVARDSGAGFVYLSDDVYPLPASYSTGVAMQQFAVPIFGVVV